jgi:Tol biopolymer transport system component
MHSGPVLVPRGLRLSIAALAILALGGAATASSAPERRQAAIGKIAFSVQHGDNDAPWDIYVVRTDGRWILRKTTRLNESDPVWSPDARHIAFEGWSIPGGSDTKIYTMNSDGTHRRRLAPGGDVQWSPGGRRIAYANDDGVYVMNPDGTRKKRLTRSGGGPRWSPDGKQIAFTHDSDVYVVSASGGHERRLTRTGDNYVDRWAPGRKIIFTHHRDDAGPVISIVNADGSDSRKVMRSTNLYDNLEIGGWSRDAQVILYADSRGVSTVRPSDGFVRRLARRGGAPTWGPGDGKVAFTISPYKDERRAGVWIVNRDGSGARRIATAYEACYDPAWAPR